MRCHQDPALTYLNGYGYNVVTYPRPGIQPLDLLCWNGRVTGAGRLTDWWDAAPVPEITAAQPCPDLEGVTTARMELATGARLLSGFLGGFGASIPSVSIRGAFHRAGSLRFSLRDVETRTASAIAIGAYLARGTQRAPKLDGRLLVITEVLQTRKLAISARTIAGSALEVRLPPFQVQLQGKLDIQRVSEGEITFTGREPVVFGLRAFEIREENTRLRLRGLRPSGGLALAAGASEDPVLINAGQLLRMR
ncbi:MAG: hypothetical protein K2X35_16305 [Bryobacteraceae bacterium]|nr:hypothetical protein [Bryobacteraceae bacterium]